MSQTTLKNKDDVELLVILVFFSIPPVFLSFLQWACITLLIRKNNTAFFLKKSKYDTFNFLLKLYPKAHLSTFFKKLAPLVYKWNLMLNVDRTKILTANYLEDLFNNTKRKCRLSVLGEWFKIIHLWLKKNS